LDELSDVGHYYSLITIVSLPEQHDAGTKHSLMFVEIEILCDT